MSDTAKKKVDWNIYAQVATGGTTESGKPLYRRGGQIGVAFNHGKGNGKTIILDGLPPSGRIVMFEATDKSVETSEDSVSAES